jgi:hypothetical protein
MDQLTTDGPPAATDGGELRRVLVRAVARSDLTREQAESILRAELGEGADLAIPAPSSRLRSLVAEALGYVGAALAMVAVFIVIAEFWADLESWSRVALPAVFSVAFTVAGAYVRATDGAIARLGSFLWLLATIGAALTMTVAGEEVLELEGELTGVLTGAVGASVGAVLWWFRREALQQVGTFAGLVIAIMAGFALIDPELSAWSGLAVWGLGIGWGLLTWAELVPPRTAGWVLSGLAALAGPLLLVGDHSWALWLGLLTAAGAVAASVAIGHTVLLALGVLGLFGYVPPTVFEFFGEALGPPVALLITGAILIGISIALTRLPRFRRRTNA